MSRALLLGVAEGRTPAALRIHEPGEALAFSVLDRSRPGFPRAVAEARRERLEPILRLAGGHAAVFHAGTLGLAWSLPCPDPRRGIHQRFQALADLLRATLESLGVDARIGEVPGEYCPGAYSLSAGGRLKLAGIGQRVVNGAAHVGAVIVVRDAERVRRALLPVYRELGLDFDPTTVGSLAEVLGEVSEAELVEALLVAFRRRHELVRTELGDGERALAARLEAQHRIDPGLQRGARDVEESQDDANARGPAPR